MDKKVAENVGTRRVGLSTGANHWTHVGGKTREIWIADGNQNKLSIDLIRHR